MISKAPQSNTFKVVVLGDSRVGKTSLIARQLLGDKPSPANPTVGCHCCEIRVAVDFTEVALQVWDTAGQEMYRSLVPVYLRGARAALLVYDVTDVNSFDSLGHWFDILMGVVPAGASVYVVGNKTDLENDAVVHEEHAKEFASVHGAQFFKVSAITGIGTQALFETVAKGMANVINAESDSAVPIDRPEERLLRDGCPC
jgi:small GTP-binding protein